MRPSKCSAAAAAAQSWNIAIENFLISLNWNRTEVNWTVNNDRDFDQSVIQMYVWVCVCAVLCVHTSASSNISHHQHDHHHRRTLATEAIHCSQWQNVLTFICHIMKSIIKLFIITFNGYDRTIKWWVHACLHWMHARTHPKMVPWIIIIISLSAMINVCTTRRIKYCMKFKLLFENATHRETESVCVCVESMWCGNSRRYIHMGHRSLFSNRVKRYLICAKEVK